MQVWLRDTQSAIIIKKLINGWHSVLLFSCYFLRQLLKFLCARWLILIVNKWTDTFIYNLRNAGRAQAMDNYFIMIIKKTTWHQFFNMSDLLLTMNFVICHYIVTVVRGSTQLLSCGSTTISDIIKMKFMIKKRTDPWKNWCQLGKWFLPVLQISKHCQTPKASEPIHRHHSRGTY